MSIINNIPEALPEGITRELSEVTSVVRGGADETTQRKWRKKLLIGGSVLLVLGLSSSVLGLNIFHLKFLNRWLHLGHMKWILSSGLFFAVLGGFMIWFSRPGSSATLKRVMAKKRSDYERVPGDDVEAAET